MASTVLVSQLPDDVFFFYEAEWDFYPLYVDQGDYDTQADCERAATEYALAHGCELRLYDDPDGSQGALALEQAIERDERMEQMEAK